MNFVSNKRYLYPIKEKEKVSRLWWIGVVSVQVFWCQTSLEQLLLILMSLNRT